jgi:hypothetical protein
MSDAPKCDQEEAQEKNGERKKCTRGNFIPDKKVVINS